MQATLYFKVDSSRIRGDGSRIYWCFEKTIAPMVNVNQTFWMEINYVNKLNWYYINIRVDYMDYGMVINGIDGSTIKIHGICWYVNMLFFISSHT
eukprot:221573_1